MQVDHQIDQVNLMVKQEQLIQVELEEVHLLLDQEVIVGVMEDLVL